MFISVGRVFSLPSWAFFNYSFAEKLIEISKASLAFLSSEEFFYARCECISLRVLALFLLPAIYHLPTYLYLFFVTVSKSRRVSLNIHEKLRSLRVFLSIESECSMCERCRECRITSDRLIVFISRRVFQHWSNLTYRVIVHDKLFETRILWNYCNCESISTFVV